jgi:hypothetical protein
VAVKGLAVPLTAPTVQIPAVPVMVIELVSDVVDAVSV